MTIQKAKEATIEILRSLMSNGSEWVDIADVGNSMRKSNVDYKEFGFEKLRPFLESVDHAIEIMKDDSLYPPVFYARLKEEAKADISSSGTTARTTATTSAGGKSLPVQIRESSLCKKLSDSECIAKVNEAFLSAREKSGLDDGLIERDGNFFFPLGMVSLWGKQSLWVKTAKKDNPVNNDWDGAALIEQTEVFRELSGFSEYTFILPDQWEKIPKYISDLTGDKIETLECEEKIYKAFMKAKNENRLGRFDANSKAETSFSYFSLDITSKHNQKLWVKMIKNSNSFTLHEWFGAFIMPEPDLTDEMLNKWLLSSGKFAMGKIIFEKSEERTKFLTVLAERAVEEKWDWPDSKKALPYMVLQSYVDHTYRRLCNEDSLTEDEKDKKIKIIGDKLYFNSGLLDRLSFKDIFICGKINNIEPEFDVFGRIPCRVIEKLSLCTDAPFSKDSAPKMASYSDRGKEFWFDADLFASDGGCILNDKHIFYDGIEKERLPKYFEEYKSCKYNEDALEKLTSRIRDDFETALRNAKKLALRNHRLVLPMFYPEIEKITFLLPIYLESRRLEKPDCVLALGLFEEFDGVIGRHYRGTTILTLEMAFNNSRLVSSRDVFWLSASSGE